MCFVKFKKFAHLDVHRNVGGLVIPGCLFHTNTYFSIFFVLFFKCCVSQGHVALTDTEGQTETSEDMPFYVRESWSWSEREGMEGGGCGAVCREVGSHATASQAKSPPYFVCMPTLAGYA